MFLLLRSEIPSDMCAKLRIVAASNNRDHARNLSSQTLVIMFNRSHVNIGRELLSFHIVISLTIAWLRYIHNNGFILHAHPARGESHND